MRGNPRNRGSHVRHVLAAACIMGSWLLEPAAASQPRATFSLTTQHGTPFTERDIDGQPIALVFGFTSCPDICPTTLLQLTQDLEALGSDGDSIRVIFVSVDPERDTPERLKEYMASFDPRIVALTGAEVMIADVARAYGAFFRKVASGGGYVLDHTASVLLLDKEGEYAGAVTHADANATRLAKLRRLLPP